MNDSTPDYFLIARELASVASPEESARLQAWIAEDPEHLRIWSVLRQAWTLSAGKRGAFAYDADADWPKVLARLERRHAPVSPAAAPTLVPGPGGDGAFDVRRVPNRRRHLWTRRAVLRAAAVAAILLVPYAGWRIAHRGLATPALAELSTPPGGTREVLLPDGSRVRLGAESGIRYAAAFDGRTRTVELRGMAFFDVVHDPARPFVVRTRDGVTARDLGTRFVVDAYPEHPRVEVAVDQGRVALTSSAAREVAIGAGEVGEVGADGVLSVAADTSPDTHFGWMHGRLVIQDRPLAEALAELGRWYGVQLKVEDRGLAARRISTTAGDRPVADVLAKITLALGAGRQQRGDTTVIVP